MNNLKAWKHILVQLRNADNEEKRFSCLATCSKFDIPGPTILKSYYNLLLLILVRAFDKKSNEIAEEELKRMTGILSIHQEKIIFQHVLSNSGLPYTVMRCQYSASMIKWLLKTFPDNLLPIEAESNGEIFRQMSQAALPGIEFNHTTQGKYNTWNRIKWLSGHYKNISALQWLINLIDQQDWSPVLKDQMYDGLKIFVSWKPGNDKTGINFSRLPVKSVFYTKSGKEKADPLFILTKKVNGPLKLSLKETVILISTVRYSLALYARETDPVTYADPGETFMYEMGEGLQIALTGMVKDRRLSLESYIGYMAFKNGIPVSYGGGWIWGHSCKIGVNIYPPFRGGDSDKLFCHIMRLYFQVYHVRRFVVKPYQFGKGNAEGLKSGAFWFYYKLGFRPVNENIRKMADLEWNKIKSDTHYRTPISVLKRLTVCNQEWKPVKTTYKFLDADKISIAITQMINIKFSSDRKLAIEKSKQEMKNFLDLKRLPNFNSVEKIIWNNWSLLFVCLKGTANWTFAGRRKFHKLIDLKSKGTEMDFIRELQQHSQLWASIEAMLKS